MSTRFEAVNSEYAGRDAVVGATALAGGGYLRIESYPSGSGSTTYAPIVTVYGSFNGFSLMVNPSGNFKVFDYNAGSVNAATGSATLSLSTWYYVWFRKASSFSPLVVYINGSTTADLTTSANIGSNAGSRLEFATAQAGGGYGTTWYADVSLCGWKLWAIDRAASNAATEDDGHALVSSTSALGAWEFNGTTVTDSHSTANHLTASGTLSTGANSPIDGGGTTYNQSLTAGLTPAATLGRQTNKTLVGSPVLATVLVLVTMRQLTAGMTPSTVLSSIATRLLSLTASVTPSAALVRRAGKALTASLTPTAVLVRQLARNLVAGMTPSAALASARLYAQSLTAGVTPSTTVNGTPTVPPVTSSERETRRRRMGWM